MDAVTKVKVENVVDYMLNVQDSYTGQIKPYVDYLRGTEQQPGRESLEDYIGAMIDVGVPAGTIGVRIAAVKKRIRQLFEQSTDSLDMGKRVKLDESLKRIKAPKIASKRIPKEKLITPEEFRRLVASPEMPDDIKLFVSFLFATGARISEVTQLRLSAVGEPNGNNRTPVRLMGKGRKQRTVRVKTELIQRINEYFKGKTWLFETKGQQYSRQRVTMRILRHSRKILGHSVTAHSFRHGFATRKIEETGKHKAVSVYLGHSSTAVTFDMYVDQELEDEELD